MRLRFIFLGFLLLLSCAVHAQNNGTRINTFVLDISAGRTAAGIDIKLFAMRSQWGLLAECTTDSSGGCGTTLEDVPIELGLHMLQFDVASYYNQSGIQCFFPTPEMIFDVRNEGEKYFIPMLLTPYSYTTYRGS